MGWKERNAEIQAAARAHLASEAAAGRHDPVSTFVLAEAIKTKVGMDAGKVSQILSRMAPHVGAMATHDGPEIVRYGRKWKRWQWHPQGGTNGT